MAVTHAVVSLGAVTGLPEDKVVNTFTFYGAELSEPDVPGELTTSLAAFYNAIPPLGTIALAEYINGSISRAAAACTIDLYDVTDHLDGSAAGPPYFSDTFTLAAEAASEDLPREVCHVLTLVGDQRANVSVEVPDDADPAGPDPGLERDRPMQRRTGRIYIGPLNQSASDTAGRPNATFRVNERAAAVQLKDAALAMTGAEWVWGVWSRRNESVYEVVSVFNDDEFDTQRRRQLLRTVRQESPLALA